MTILGISAFYHDSAAAIIMDGKIIAAAQEERFTRKKHDPGFPINAIRFCLAECEKNISEIDAVVFYDKPFLKFERLLETYYAVAPKGFLSFIMAMPVWIKEKIFLKRLIYNELEELPGYDKKKIKLLFPEHHLSHAASAFFASPYNEAAILTIDGVGEWATASIGIGNGNSISVLKELHFPHSVGLLYSAFTYYLGFKVNSGEYKLMGLAPYGDPDAPQTNNFINLIKDVLVDIKQDGSIHLNQAYFSYTTGLRMVPDGKWQQLFGFAKRNEEDAIEQFHCNLAYAIQKVTEEVVLKMAAEAKRLTGAENLCMAGGVALNAVANGVLMRSGLFKNIFIQPAAGDAGGALGAALAGYYIYYQNERIISSEDEMQGAYLGPQFSSLQIESALEQYHAVYKRENNFDELTNHVTDLLADDKVIGWFQGKMEFGPRALGNRSILADARNPQIQQRLNKSVKKREAFRPFAPSVLEEDASEYFELSAISPYMLFTAPVKQSRRKELPAGYRQFPFAKQLSIERSDIPAVTHLDFSARAQTVSKQTNERYWKLLNAFKQKTGYSVLVNTSFNMRGEPPVCTPADAYRCFMETEMDYLVIGDYILSKADQPKWNKGLFPTKAINLD